MRFRLWDQVNKKMITWQNEEANYCIALNGDIVAIEYGETPFNITEPPYMKIMQFTGLKDSKGVDIFEGDIVKGVAKNDGHSEVFFDGGVYQPFSYLSCFEGSEFKIIGNVWENEELSLLLTE